MIIEGLVTTRDEDGTAHVAPMGPIVTGDFAHLVMRPYGGSRTLANLLRSGHGVFHITDDVELLARAAVGELDPPPTFAPLDDFEGSILTDCCRWYAFRVMGSDVSNPRAQLDCDVVMRGRLRDFIGFNRAKHAVLEAAILATRVQLLPREEIEAEMLRLAIPVAKTAGPEERRAFQFLQQFIAQAFGTTSPKNNS